MNTNKLTIADELRLDGTCRAAVIRLVELRARYDVDQEQADLDEAEVKADKLENKKDGWFKDFRKGRSEKKAGQLKELIASKQRWAEQWSAGAWQEVGRLDATRRAELEAASLDQLRALLEADAEIRLKRYLVLQDAVLVPLYQEPAAEGEELEELDVKEGCDIMARHLGFPSRGGREILKEVQALIKGASGFWDKVGAEIDSLFKSESDADTASGESLGTIPPEALIAAAAKLIAYSRWLAEQVGEDRDIAAAARVRAVDQFLRFKHEAERVLIDGLVTEDALKQALRNLGTLEYALRELVNDAAGVD